MTDTTPDSTPAEPAVPNAQTADKVHVVVPAEHKAAVATALLAAADDPLEVGTSHEGFYVTVELWERADLSAITGLDDDEIDTSVDDDGEPAQVEPAPGSSTTVTDGADGVPVLNDSTPQTTNPELAEQVDTASVQEQPVGETAVDGSTVLPADQPADETAKPKTARRR